MTILAAALDYRVSIATPVALAAEYGASMHATIRYYALDHPDPVSVLVAGRYPEVATAVSRCSGASTRRVRGEVRPVAAA